MREKKKSSREGYGQTRAEKAAWVCLHPRLKQEEKMRLKNTYLLLTALFLVVLHLVQVPSYSLIRSRTEGVVSKKVGCELIWRLK